MFVPVSVPGYVLFGLVAIVVSLFGIVVYQLYFSKPQKKEKKDTDLSHDEIVSAHRESRVILDKAAEKAQELLLDADYVKEDITREMEDGIRSIASAAVSSFQGETHHLHEQYKKLFADIKKQYEDEVGKSVSQIDNLAKQELDSFRKILKEETVSAQDMVEKKTQKMYEDAQKDIFEYKKRKMEEIDSEVISMVDEIFQEVLGKSLSQSDHEELVVAALKNAQKKGLSVSNQ